MGHFNQSSPKPYLHLDDYSHEIRNPLNGIIGMTNILLDTKLDSSQKNIIHNIQKGSSELLETLNSILNLSDILSGNTTYYPEQILINPYLQKILHELFLVYQHKRAKLCYFVSPDLKPIAIFDPIITKKLILEIGKYILHICHEPIINLDIFHEDHNLKIEFSFNQSSINTPDQPRDNSKYSEQLLKGAERINHQLTIHLLTLTKGTIDECIHDGMMKITLNMPIQYSRLHQIIEPDRVEEKLAGLHILFYNYQSDSCESIAKYFNHWGIHFKVIQKDFQNDITSIPDHGFDIIGVDISELRDHEFIILDKIRAHSQLPVIFFKNTGKSNSKITSLQKDVVVVGKPISPQDLALVIHSVIKSEADALRNWHKNSMQLISEYQDTLKILIVDDEIINQRILSEYLSKLKLKADLAANGQQALIWYKEKKYDLIFMDIQMPIMNGIQATQAIRAQQDNHKPYIIAVTGEAIKGGRKSYAKNGLNDIVPKPVEIEDIKQALSKYIKYITPQ